jgi:hypothetical protein
MRLCDLRHLPPVLTMWGILGRGLPALREKEQAILNPYQLPLRIVDYL